LIDWNSYKIDPEYLKKYQWINLPSTFAVLFVALTKGDEDLGFWLTLPLYKPPIWRFTPRTYWLF